MWRPLQRTCQYSIGFITTFWRPLLRHVETHCQSVALGSNHSSSTFDFCNTSSVKRHGTEIASKKLTPVQKKRVINVALAAAGTTLFKSTTLKDKQWAALAMPGGEGEGRRKPSPQGIGLFAWAKECGCWRLYTPHDPKGRRTFKMFAELKSAQDKMTIAFIMSPKCRIK